MKRIVCVLVFLLVNCIGLLAQNTWTQKAGFTGAARRSAIGFCIGNQGFVGTGYNANFYDDMWKYDPVNDSWTQVAGFPGAARFSAVSFVIGNFAFVGTGYDVNNNFNTSDFWRYDAGNNSWSQSASLPAGQERRYASAFSAQGRGYVGTGVGAAGYLNDLWQYDAGSNTWAQKSNFPGAARYECVAFTIGEYGYIGCGAFAGTIFSDFFEYQPQNDLWVQKADYPGAGGDAAAGFALEGRGYIGTGSTQGTYPVDFYEWNQYDNVWMQKANFPAAGRAFGTGFAILGKGYMGLGESSGYFNDWWEYTPDSLFNPVPVQFSTNSKPLVKYAGHVLTIEHEIKAGESVVLTFFDAAGRKISEIIPGKELTTMPFVVPGGLYFWELEGNSIVVSGKIFVFTE